MIELFTGESVTEGVINDQPFVNSAKFGAFPVQVEGNADLHDSLEAATVSREMQQEVCAMATHVFACTCACTVSVDVVFSSTSCTRLQSFTVQVQPGSRTG